MTDELAKLIEDAKRRWSAMAPQKRAEMHEAQRRSYITAEAGFGSDEEEAEYAAAIASGDPARIAAVKAAEEVRMAAARAILELGMLEAPLDKP